MYFIKMSANRFFIFIFPFLDKWRWWWGRQSCHHCEWVVHIPRSSHGLRRLE